MSKRCPYCHEYFDAEIFDQHLEIHEQVQPDGQMTDYLSVPPEERFSGSIENEPKWYVHHECGAKTSMPEYIIRSYLVNPYLYTADRTFCVGCELHVPYEQCQWVETGENLAHYFNRLKQRTSPYRPSLFTRIMHFFRTGNWV